MATEKKRKSNAELFQEYQESLNKKDNADENASKRLSNRELYKYSQAATLLEENPTAVEDFNARMKSFTELYNSFANDYHDSYAVYNTTKQLKREAEILNGMLSEYGALFDDNYVLEASNWLNSMNSSVDKGAKHWSQWKTRDDYDTAVRMNGYYTKYQGMTPEEEAQVIKDLNLRYAEASAAGSEEAKLIQEEIDFLYNYGSKETQIAGRKKQYDYNNTEITRINAEINALESKVGNSKSEIVSQITAIENTLNERKRYYRGRAGLSEEKAEEMLRKTSEKELTELAELRKKLEQLAPYDDLVAQRDSFVAENNRYDRTQGIADDTYSEYAKTATLPEFAEYVSKGESLDNGMRYGSSASIIQLNPNRVAAEREEAIPDGATDEQKYAAYANSLYLNMTEEEVALYNYYLGKEGKEKANNFLKELKPELERRMNFSKEEMLAFHMNKDGWEGDVNTAIFNAATVLAKPYVDATAFVDNTITQVFNNGEVNPYSKWQTGQNTVNYIREATTKAIEANNPDAKLWGKNVWGQIYNAGMSTLDSLYGATTFGKFYSVIAASGAASSKAKELYEKGATGDQIFLGGTAAGLAEYVFEKVSVENLIKTKNPDSIRKVVWEIFKQAGIEGSEEVFTEIANIISDSIIMGSQSDLSLTIKAYEEEGLSYEEAYKKALLDKATDVAWAGLSGFMSGGASGGITTTHQGISNAIAGKGIKKQGDTDAMIMAGIDASQDSQAYKLAEKAFRDYTEGDALYRLAEKVTGADSKITQGLSKKHGAGNVSNMRLGALKQTTMEDVVDQYRNREQLSESDIQAKLESKGIDSKKAAEFASIVAKVAKGDKLSERETETLKSNEDAQTIANEIASAEAVNNFATRVQLAKIDSLGREATPETPDTYDVSKTEGKTLMKDSGAEVNIEDIESIKDGKMMLKVNDGTEVKTVNAENISFATNQEAILYETVARMDIDAASAKAIIGNFDAKSDMSAGKYIYGAYEAFRYGKYNFSPEEMSKNGFSADLTEEQKTFAYNLGKNVQVSNVNAQEGAVKKAIEGAKTSNKAKGDKKGEVIYEDGKTALTDRQDASAKALEVVAKALGINIYLYESTLDDKGRRAYIDKDGKRVTANGWYDPNTGDIHIDINAGQGGEGVMLFTAAHELTHFIRQWSPAKFKVLADFLMAEYGKEGVPVAELVRYQQDLARRQGRKLSYDQAYEEMIADSMETMLADGAVVEKLAKLAKKDKTLVEKMVDFIDKLVKDIKSTYADITHSTDAGMYAAMLNEGERLQELFYDALVSAGQNYNGAGGKTNLANAEMRLMARELGNDLGSVERTDNGDIALITNKDNSLVLYSPRTYEEGGRDKLEATLKANGHTQEEINDTLKLIDDAADYLRILAAGYAKQNYGKLGERLSEHLEATVTTDLKGHKQVLSTLVNNGDYPVNLDLALICKKRVAYMRLMTRLIEDGVFGDVVYGGDAIAEVNAILREDGFETACLGCFVESRRLQFQTWAETIVQEWNEAVDAHTKNAGYFSFAKGGKGNLTEADMDAMEAELKGQKKNDKGNVNLGQGSAVARMNRLLDKTPSLAKKLTVDDLLTPQGLTTLRKADGNLFSIVKSRYGAASPKIVQEFSPYASEIANLTFNYVKKMTGESISGGQGYIRDAQKELAAEKPVKEKGEIKEDFKARKKAWDDKVETLAMNNYLFAIGGARIQSFSDFMIENVFDYIQIMADLAAKGSPLHGYTKEIACLRLFGMTGAKWNGSLIAHVEKSMGKEMAGLMPASEAKNGNAILVHTPKGDYAIGFDDYARHMATNKKSFIQSIGMKDIVALMLDPRYSANVGNITIGVSDMQILGMLDSPLFRMVIPYHASGMLPQFAQLVGVDFYNDYTNYQNTTVKQYFDLEGNPVESLGDKAKVDTSFKYNAEVQKLAKAGVKDAPRQAANNYIAWCGKMHPVYEGKKRVGYATFSPKFSDSPYGTDFSKHKNYYKLLEDFNMYDNNTEVAAMQEAVKMVLPSEANRLNADEMEAYKQALRDTGIFTEADITKYAKKADMTFEEIIKAEMDNRQAYEEETDPKWDATVKKVEDHLKKHHPRDGQAKSAEDYKKAKGDSAISKIKAVDGSYAIQIAPKEMKLSARDSEGNTLTEAQQEYFKDSKVRDKKGNLLVLYHGTNAHFTVFNSNHSDDKMSFFLTDSPDVAHSYARSDMILNPYDFLDEEATPNKVADVAEKVVSNWNSVKVFDSKSAEKANKTIVNSIADVKNLIGTIAELTKNSQFGRSFFMQGLLTSSNMFDSWTQTGKVFASQNPFEATTTKAATILTLVDEGILELPSEVITTINDLINATTPLKPLFDIAKAYADGGTVFEVVDHLDKTSYVSEVMVRKNINWAQSGGLMPLYANIKKPLIVEAGGRRWNNIKRPSEMDESYPETVNTRMVSDFANKNGYDGVIFKGLVDMGGYSPVKSQRSTVVVAFDGNQLKSTQNTNPTSDPDIRYSERDYSYDELVSKPDMKGITIEKSQQVKLSADGSIDASYIVSEVYDRCEKIQTKGASPTYFINVPDIDRNVEITSKGITHGFFASTRKGAKPSPRDLINARVSFAIPEILANSIEVNQSYRAGNMDVPYSHVMMGTVGLENATGNIEYYAVRSVIEERINQNPILVEAKILGRLHAVNAKKIGSPNLKVAKKSVARRYDETYAYSIADLLNDVKDIFDDTFSEDVYNYFSTQRKDNDFSKNLLFSERDLAPTFYSKMGKEVEDVKQEKLGAASVIPMLTGKGVKAEEIRWSGIHTFLEGKKSVTKQELLDFINGSMLEIGEQMSGTDTFIADDGNTYESETAFKEAAYAIADKKGIARDSVRFNIDNKYDMYAYAFVLNTNEALLQADVEGGTRWAEYKLNGGENYREIVFTMPNSSYSNQMMRTHWGEDAKGVIAHARIQDFDVNGKKMLFIEEIQSDWHNEGQKVGYEDKNFSKYIEERDSYISKKLADLYGKTTWDDLNSSYGYEIMGEKKYKSALASMEEIYAEWKKANPEKAKITDAEGIVPDAPFKDNYHEFVLKRLLRMAAEQGYDSIGWTTADTQSKRWSDKYAEGYRIEYDQDMPKFLGKYGRQWGAKVEKSFIPNSNGANEYATKRISAIEKDIKSYQDELKTLDENSDYAQFIREGILDLENTLNSLKEKTKGIEVWSMDITDSMRDSVLYEGQALYSERDPNATSNRSLLANALENAAQNDIEKNKLKQYKEKIDFINAEERKLADLNRQLKELRFSKGKRDTIKTKQINDLQAEATKTANRISIYDKQLLNLEASKPLKNVLEREKIKARKKQKQRDAEILQEQKDKANATIREIMNRHTESRKKATEGRHKTVVRNKIKRTINDLNSVFNRGTKDRNVKTGLRDTVRKALEASEVLFSDEITNEDIVRLGVDSVSEQDSEKLNRYATLLALRETKEDALEISRINSQISRLNSDLKDVFIRERARLNKENVSMALDSLAEAYASLQNSDDDYIKNNAFVQGMHDRIKSLSENLNGVTIKDMSLEQLEEVYKMYSSVKHMIVNANSIFRDGLREDLSKKIMTVQGEILALQKDNRKDPRVIVDAINNAIKSFDWNNQKPVYAFEKLGSQAFQELFWDAIKAEGVYAQDVVEAGEFLDAQKDKFKYADWDFKKAKTFKSANGLDFKLTLSDMMSIYAYSKRPQAFEHMTQGGFTFDRGSVYVDEKGRKRKHVRLSETYTVSIELINEIVKTLSEEQISYVDAVQAYLTSLGEKGNEISRVLYGIDLFTEKVYFPLKSDADYRSSVEQALNETQTQVSLKNTGMTKQTVPHANNPIVLQGFDDVVLGHIDNMSKYHSFVLPIENLRRVFDNVSKDENASYDATKVIIESVFGESAKQYFDQYITDLNGGVHIGGYQNIMMDMFSKMKKTAVSASLSVVVQQPFAITRAMDMINPVYFAPVNLNAAKKHTNTKSQWEELKKYAPVAIIKEMGGFDVGSSRTTRDYIGGTNYKGLGGKVKGFFKDSDYRNASLDNMFMWGAAKADELGWSTIWKAVKNEVASQHKELAVGSEEFLKKCGERFTEVVVYTQVYDSVNSRSGMMRSKKDLDKFATSFMGEPTTTINMVENSMIKLARAVKTKDGKAIAKASAKMGRTVGVTLASILLTSLAKSLVYAGRDDDDEDKALLERWSKHFGDSLKSDLNPLTMIPYLRDFVSIWEGWDVERPDMTVVADIVTSIKKAIEEGCTVEEALALIGNAGNAFGLPVKNIIREVQGAINVFGDITDNIEPTDIGGAFAEGWTGEEQSNKDALYKAIINGDEAKIEAIRAEYKTEDAYEQAIRKGLRENDPRIKEAAQARIDGDISKYSAIVREIKAEGHFSQDTIVAAVNAEINLINKEAKEQNAGGNDEIEDTKEKATSIYKASDINAAFENGDTNMALTIINDLVETKVSNGMTEKEAKSSVKSSMTSYWKPLLIEAYNNKDAAEQKRIRQILIASGLYGRTSEVIETTQQWIKNSKKTK